MTSPYLHVTPSNCMTIFNAVDTSAASCWPSAARLAVAATAPRYATGYTYSAPNAVDAPPAHAASCTSAAAATSKAEADSATSTAAETSTSSTSSTAATAAAVATPAATTAASSELNSGLERTGVFFVEDVESRQAHVGDFFLTKQDSAARFRI